MAEWRTKAASVVLKPGRNPNWEGVKILCSLAHSSNLLRNKELKILPSTFKREMPL